MKETLKKIGETVKLMPKASRLEKQTKALSEQFKTISNLSERVKLKDTVIADFEVDKDTFVQILILVKDSHFKELDGFDEYYEKEIKDVFKK